MRNLWLMALWFACAATVSSSGSTIAADVNEFIDFSDPALPGRLYVPPEATTSTEPRPLILFLHGAGETGSNNQAQVNRNIDNLLAHAKARGAFLYAPQATTFTWAASARTTTVMSMVDQALSQYSVDGDRLYVTGLSMGGGGVWNMLNRFDDRFAVGVPIAAVSPASDFEGSHLIGKPTWAFHARDDGTVSTVASRLVVNNVLSAAAAAPLIFPPTRDPSTTLLYTNEQVGIHFTELPRGGHGIWGAVYDTPELYDWMFSHSRAQVSSVAPAGGGQIIMNNLSARLPIADSSGIAIPAGTGFAAVGTFTLSDEDVSLTQADSLATLASSFTQFGSSLPLGVNGLEGLFSANIGAPFATDDPLIGESIYLVVGDGRDMQDSDSLFVFKSSEQFSDVSPALTSTIALDDALDTGEILLGTLGTVFANRLGGFRPGILAAAVNIPEPTAAVLILLGAMALLSYPRSS